MMNIYRTVFDVQNVRDGYLSKCKCYKQRDKRDATFKDVSKHTYLCSKHFVNINGPCTEYPDSFSELSVMQIWKVTCILKDSLFPFFTYYVLGFI